MKDVVQNLNFLFTVCTNVCIVYVSMIVKTDDEFVLLLERSCFDLFMFYGLMHNVVS